MLLLALQADAVHAQVDAAPRFQRGTLMVRAELGGAAFTDFQRGVARAPADPELGDFRRRISAATTATVGGSATYWVGNTYGVRASVSYAPSSFNVWNDSRAQRVLDARNGGERETWARLGIWFVDAAAVYRLPVSLGGVVPYGLVGGGLVEYRRGGSEAAPPEAEDRFAGGRWGSAAAVFGIGAAIGLQRHDLMLDFELTNRLTRTPLDEEARGEWVELGGATVQLDRDQGRGDDGIGATNHLRLTVGVTLPIR
jgi:hypothetical protein